MPDIDVKGLGVLSFPDDMSETDIEKAIKSHPGYAKARDKSNFTPLIEPPSWVKSWLGDPRDAPNPLTVTKEVGKGIPIAGHYIPQDEDMTSMEKNYPIATGLARTSGTIGSMGPASFGMGALTGTNAALTGAKMIPAIAGQSALGGLLGAGDVAAEKGKDVTGKDLLEKGTIGALWGSTGPIVSKLLSPGTVIPTRPTGPTRAPPVERPSVESIRARSRVETGVDPAVNSQLQALLDSRRAAAQAAQQTEQRTAQQTARDATQTRLENLRPSRAAPSSHNDSIRDILLALGTGGAAHIMGATPLMTMAAATAGAVGPHVPAMTAKYLHNINMVQPNTKDIINALMTSQGVGQ